MKLEVKPTEWEGLLRWAESLIGHELPAAARYIIGVLVVIALLALILGVIVLAVVKIKQAWTDHLRPRAYSPEQRHRSSARRDFAAYLAEEVHKRNRSENWQDREYSELEAEVEAEGSRRRFLFIGRRSRGIRRERSLAVALRRSSERLILVEGDPGSGKSVALRHVAVKLAELASRSKRLDTVLPVYVNLKELKRPAGASVDAELIRSHILETLKRVHNRSIDTFLDQEFDEGLNRGTWIFLFDSFDELPDVLSATDADAAVTDYSEAVSDFLSVAHRCRGILASRYYRGPTATGWSTFRILPLSLKRQHDLIRKATPDYKIARSIETALATASADIQSVARNPMLLGLLCEQIGLSGRFPQNSYELMRSYILHRFARDGDRVLSRYSLSSETVSEVAQAVAFAMTEGLGLSPKRDQLESAVITIMGGDDGRVSKGLNALVYMRLARTDDSSEPEFTFAHRRFQEYFATQALLSGGHDVSSEKLLTDARWRETAVALLQHQDAAKAAPLLEEATSRLSGLALMHGADLNRRGAEQNRGADDGHWTWPKGSLHILGILHAGLPSDVERVPQKLRGLIGWFVDRACRRGDLLDAKLALRIAGPAPEAIIIDGMRAALSVRSVWLEDAVYWLAARLTKPNPHVTVAIARSVARLVKQGDLFRLYASTYAYIQRLPDSGKLLNILRYAYWLPVIDFVSLIAVCIPVMRVYPLPVILLIAFKLNLDLFKSNYLRFLVLRTIDRYSRLGVVILLFVLFYGPTEPNMTEIAIGIDGVAHFWTDVIERIEANAFYVILLLWWLTLLPSAIAQISEGRPVSYMLWPVPNISLLANMFIEVWRLRREVVVGFREIGWSILLGIVIPGLAVVIFSWLSSMFPAVMEIIGIVFFGVVGLFMTFGISLVIIESVKESQNYRKDKKDISKTEAHELESPDVFVDLCSRLRTLQGKNLLLSRLLQVDLTKKSEEWTRTLREFISRDPTLSRLSQLPFGKEEEGAQEAHPRSRRVMLKLASGVFGSPSTSSTIEQRELAFTLLEGVASAEMSGR